MTPGSTGLKGLRHPSWICFAYSAVVPATAYLLVFLHLGVDAPQMPLVLMVLLLTVFSFLIVFVIVLILPRMSVMLCVVFLIHASVPFIGLTCLIPFLIDFYAAFAAYGGMV